VAGQFEWRGTELKGTSEPSKWIMVVGARPNFMKVPPDPGHSWLQHQKGSRIRPFLVHTGQNYDVRMSPFPVICNCRSRTSIWGSVREITASRVLIEFEKILLREQSDLVIVVGDVNSTRACALAAVKLHIPVYSRGPCGIGTAQFRPVHAGRNQPDCR
jgi:UDP-N-acetylglucosamine 2-epimerase (non-hydrolysing)